MEGTKKSFDIPKFKEQYENYIGGEWVAPKSGEYFDCISPVDGKSFTKVARSNEEDVNAALAAVPQITEIITTGIGASCGSALSWPSTFQPSSPGINTSSRMRLGRSSRARRRACATFGSS